MNTNIKLLYLLVLFSLSLSACFRGCGSQDKESGNEYESDYKQEGGLVGAVKNLEKAVKNMEENMNELQEPINFREFKKNLEERVNGMERISFNGETSGVKGFKVSTAKATYEKKDKKLTAEIMDVGGVALGPVGVAAWSALEKDMESDTHMERTSSYKGFKVYEKYNYTNKSGEFSAILFDRFIVNLKAWNMKMEEIKEVFDDLDFDNLKKYAPKKKKGPDS